MPRARNLLWVTTTASCLLAGGPDEASQRQRGSSHATDPGERLGPERDMSARQARAALWPNLRGQGYEAASTEHVEATQQLLAATMTYATGSTDGQALPQLALAAGLLLQRWKIDEHHYLAILEGPDGSGRTGAFLLRLGPPPADGRERLLQAPHAFFDMGTGRVTLDVLLARPADFRGLATNTLQRYVQPDGTKKKSARNPADVCHNHRHPFVAATVGMAEASDALEVIQLHGFGDDRTIPELPEAWAIVSAGSLDPGWPRVTAVATALERDFGVTIARYPEDVELLGGTTNVIGQRVRSIPDATFLHLELSSNFRTKLRQKPEWSRRFAAALVSAP
ncbi:MAG: hypothetical protein AAF799_37275 [Myxococcota bacterium]